MHIFDKQYSVNSLTKNHYSAKTNMTTVLILLTAALIAVTSCARLEPQYLPPRPGGGGGSGGGYGGGSGGGGSSFGGSGAGTGGNGGLGGGSFGGSTGSFGGSSSGGGAQIPILKYENVNNGDGTYRYSYETGNGISAQESGAPRAPGPEGPAVTAEGSFSYNAPDGQQIQLTYTADENGFHPVGPHLPTPPPIPEEILRSIEFNKQNPSSEGAYNPGAGGSGSGSGIGGKGSGGNAAGGGYHY